MKNPASFNIHWHAALISVFTTVLAILSIYHEVVRFTVQKWLNNETFTHGLLILPISLWLIWRKRASLSGVSPVPNYWGIIALILLGIIWQLGHQAGAMVVQQYSLIGMLIASVWTLLGNEVFRRITFPLFFLLLAVPFGEALIPGMMNFTADFTVAALQFSGIPVYREGTFFSLANGNWSVVEACSGLRYFVSSLTLGVLYAYLTYQSLYRRLLFILASVIVPIIANGLRAYMIVMIGHFSGMHLAVGIDHLIYGWIFFGIVMMLLFWIGSMFREDESNYPTATPESITPMPQQKTTGSFVFALAIIIFFLLFPPLYAMHLNKTPSTPVELSLTPPPASEQWQADPHSLSDWAPHYLGSRTSFTQNYKKEGKAVSLYIAYYRGQSQGFELISSVNQLVTTDDKVWGNVGEAQKTTLIDNARLPLMEANLRSSGLRLLVWQWYWVDEQWVINPYLAKALEAKSRLIDGRGDAAVVILATPFQDDAVAAEKSMHDFLQQMLPAIRLSLSHALKSGHDN